MTEEQMVTITKAKYDQLLEDQKFLECLQMGGVDNWEWYDAAIEQCQEDNG